MSGGIIAGICETSWIGKVSPFQADFMGIFIHLKYE